MTYDTETLLSDIEKLLKDKLNAKLAAITSEKNDAIALKQIDDSAYFLQSMNDKIANFDPFIFYGVEEVQSTGEGPYTVEEHSIVVLVVLVDSGQDPSITKRVFRYSRALKEVIHENFGSIPNGGRLKIKSLVPVEFKMLNSGDTYRAVGVTIDAAVG